MGNIGISDRCNAGELTAPVGSCCLLLAVVGFFSLSLEAYMSRDVDKGFQVIRFKRKALSFACFRFPGDLDSISKLRFAFLFVCHLSLASIFVCFCERNI